MVSRKTSNVGGGMKLSQNEIQNRMDELSQWSVDHDQITRCFKLKNFMVAIKFVNLLAERAEAMDHHPDILISNYNHVTITLSTHHVNGLTENDFTLANEIEHIFNTLSTNKD
jgi:4a-hydroxytetrahydrobiopterin dehydratase